MESATPPAIAKHIRGDGSIAGTWNVRKKQSRDACVT